MIDLSKQGDVYILTMRTGENRFNEESVRELNAALDEVEGSSGAAALVTTGEGKFYSNGLDLAWMLAQGAAAAPFVESVVKLLGRVLTFPMATVAALNGHAFAAGAMLATAHDYRVMRSDRGYYCIPEIDIKLPLTPGMSALLAARLPGPVVHEAIITGRRWTAQEALDARIVDAVASEAEVVSAAVQKVAGLTGKDRRTMKALKSGLYPEVLKAMQAPQGF